MLFHSIQSTFRHRHTETRYDAYVPDFVYGGIDGTISSFVIVSGATGANFELPVFLILGIGTLVAGGLSMGVGGFLSSRSERDMTEKRRNESAYSRTLDSAKCSAYAGLTIFASYVIIGSIPLIVYILAPILAIEHLNLFLISSIGTAISLSIVGIVKSSIAKKSILIGVSETLLLCGLAATIAYLIGYSLEKIIL